MLDLSINEWREKQRYDRAGHHGVNAYQCQECDGLTVTIDVDPGATPMLLACRATEGCDGTATSSGYPKSEPPQHVLERLKWEWATPTPGEYAAMDEAMRAHIDNGGLVLQPWSGRPSAYIAPQRGADRPAMQSQMAAYAHEDKIEVKYTPNRAERRARQQAARRSLRRGARAQDRKIAEMKKQMTREEIDRAELLAAKQAQIEMLREASRG